MLMSFFFSRGLDMGSLSMDQVSVDLPKSDFEPGGIVHLHSFNHLK